MLGSVLLATLPIVILTGLLSYLAYAPQLRQAIPGLPANQIAHPDALLALRVNGLELTLDHGYPARVIVPALPGVHNTKWVASIDFEAG